MKNPINLIKSKIALKFARLLTIKTLFFKGLNLNAVIFGVIKNEIYACKKHKIYTKKPRFLQIRQIRSIKGKKKQRVKPLNNNVRDYTDVETPCSIPNQEAKHIVGDDTTPYWQGESSSSRTCYFVKNAKNRDFSVIIAP